MKCKECEEIFDEEKFNKCPYCLTQVEDTNKNVRDFSQNDFCENLDNIERQVSDKDEKTQISEFDTDNKMDIYDKKIYKNKIIEVYPISYKSFLNYCEENNLIYMSDLNVELFKELLNVKGFGITKVDKIIKIFENFNSIELDAVNTDFKNLEKEFIVNQEIGDVNIDIFRLVGLSTRTRNALNEIGIVKVKDFSIRYNTKKKVLNSNVIKEVEEFKEWFCFEPIELYKELLYFVVNTAKYQALLLRAEGFTLQEIGEELGLTRERVRQIVEKTSKNLENLIKIISNGFYKESVQIPKDMIFEKIGNMDYAIIFVFCLKQIDNIEYLSFADTFVLNNTGSSFEADIVGKIVDIIGESGNFQKILSDIEIELENHELNFLEVNDIRNLLIKCKYRIYGDYVFSRRVTYGYLASIIIKDYFPQGIQINQNDNVHSDELIILRNLLKSIFGVDKTPASDRALSARLSDYLVMSDRSKLIAEENVKIDEVILEEIIEWIDNRDNNEIFYVHLFNQFKGKLTMLTNIDNYHFLHGVLKFYYPERYHYGRDAISKRKVKWYHKESAEDQIAEYIRKCGHKVNKTEIKRVLGFNETMISSAVYSRNQILQLSNGYLCLVEWYSLNEVYLEFLDYTIKKYLENNDGYCSAKMLFQCVLESNKNMLHEYGIENHTDLYYICLYFFINRYEFRYPHICDVGRFANLNSIEIILTLLDGKDIINSTELIAFATEIGWTNVTTSKMIQEIENKYYRISQDEYIENFSCLLNFDAIHQIERVVIEQMNNNVLPLRTIDDWENFPAMGYKWNGYILQTIIKNYSTKLQVVEPLTKDKRYLKGLIIKTDLGKPSYTGVIANALYNDNIFEISEGSFLAYLVVHEFAKSSIPEELYHCDEMIFSNGIFKILEKPKEV